MIYINILSLDRSRSTVVNVYLANLINGIALGEVSSTINPRFGEKKSLSKSICACGKKNFECKFWSPILKSSNVSTNFINSTSTGNFVESSKTINHSNWLRKNCRNKLVGLFLIRSFDEWSKSVLRVINKKQEGLFKDILFQKGFRKSALRLFLRRIYFFRLIEYYSTNIRLIIEIKKYKIKYMIFSSKDLDIIKKFKNESGNYFNHILRGNRAASKFINLKNWDSNKCFHVRLIKKIFLIF